MKIYEAKVQSEKEGWLIVSIKAQSIEAALKKVKQKIKDIMKIEYIFETDINDLIF